MTRDRATTRRRLLLGAGGGAAVALAGCLGGTPSGADSVPVRGDPEADVVLEVYEDLGCPSCRQYVQNGFPTIQADFLDDQLIRYEHRDFIVTDPPDQVGAAERAANAAREVLDRHGDEAFWQFTGAVFNNQNRLRSESPGLFGELAGNLGFDADAVESAAVDLDHESAIDADRNRGDALGVGATPSFVLDGDLLDPPRGTMNQLVSGVSRELARALSDQ